MRWRTTPATGPIEPWSRDRLLKVAVAVVTAAAVLVVGLGLGVAHLIGDRGSSKTAVTLATAVPVAEMSRDEIANSSMLSVAPDQGRPGARMASTYPPIIQIPASTAPGAAGVPSGFPQSPVGALAQLGALMAEVLNRMDVTHTAEVYRAWSVPQAPPLQSWALMSAVHSFLQAAKLSRLEPGHVVVTTPVGAQVKGTDGPEWTLACVLVTVRARVKAEARIAYGHCERMTWVADRWVIGPGEAPARAPSTWPGSEAMLAAGWSSWEERHPH